MGHRLGLIVNPIAGLGGAVGLAGTDGERANAARALGAKSLAGDRALLALRALQGLDVVVETCSGAMGATVVALSGLRSEVVVDVPHESTSSADTRRAAAILRDRRVDLLLAVGGDGTARDVLEAVGRDVPVLGIPAGVKMHSAIFAATPRTAGEVARAFLTRTDREALLQEAEVMDRETPEARSAPASPRLYGFLRVPKISFFVPHAKAASILGDDRALEGAVQRVAELVQDERISLLGPGMTIERVKRSVGCSGSPLAVAAARNGHCLGHDLNEAQLLALVANEPARLVVGVVGGQGFLFGRGNQQFSPRVIRAVGPQNIVVLAAAEKLLALESGALLVDTGDEALDDALAGFVSVIVSAKRTLVFPVKNAGREIRSSTELPQ
ncbi:MAG TPA: NAD(+)/NADH kinase [Steroidobacteraceae bacterium]|nr:NAD(+)/NADH kinase [Steroidobacteraceae bacterium]